MSNFNVWIFILKDELDALKAKISKLESEKTSLQEDNQRLEQKVGFWQVESTNETLRNCSVQGVLTKTHLGIENLF